MVDKGDRIVDRLRNALSNEWSATIKRLSVLSGVNESSLYMLKKSNSSLRSDYHLALCKTLGLDPETGKSIIEYDDHKAGMVIAALKDAKDLAEVGAKVGFTKKRLSEIVNGAQMSAIDVKVLFDALGLKANEEAPLKAAIKAFGKRERVLFIKAVGLDDGVIDDWLNGVFTFATEQLRDISRAIEEAKELAARPRKAKRPRRGVSGQAPAFCDDDIELFEEEEIELTHEEDNVLSYWRQGDFLAVIEMATHRLKGEK